MPYYKALKKILQDVNLPLKKKMHLQTYPQRLNFCHESQSIGSSHSLLQVSNQV